VNHLRNIFKLLILLSCIWPIVASSAVIAAQPNIALFYGADAPWDELHVFDVVVVEPQHVPDPKLYANGKTALFAYVSVGEAGADTPYLKLIPENLKLGSNPDWGSTVLDQSKPEWPAFFVDQVIKPLWNAGYRGFFLDTLDSYHLYAKTDAKRARQEEGLVAVIQQLKKQFPEARLIMNRGFEILPRVHSQVFALAAESLYQGWNAGEKQYVSVSSADHDWLLEKLKQAKEKYGLQVLSIEYVAPGNRELARETAKKIRALGFIPWVSNPELDMLGLGNIEVMPRKILMVHNSADTEFELAATNVLNFGTLPLNYLGYTAEYLDAREALPEMQLSGRYAGIVVWLDKTAGKEGSALASWLAKQMAAGVKVVLLGDVEFMFAGSNLQQLGLQLSSPEINQSPLHIAQRNALIGYEAQPVLDRQSFYPLHAENAEPLLTLADDQGVKQEAIAITPWGGYALNPNVLVDIPMIQRKTGKEPNGSNIRWVINPIEFMRLALHLPEMPVPDVTTENGRRLLMVHMDGDGFANKAEFPGLPYAAEILRDRILKKYPLPSTISVIEGETSINGVYPTQSAALEPLARDIFALPNVEIASHSFSHPFSWEKVENSKGGEGENLPVPNYKFDLHKEISGSVSYIENHLAPPGKKVKVFLWTGDCNPGADALEMTERSGILNMNGGDTVMTRSLPSLTLVAPLGTFKKGFFQVYAPNQNENVYTNDWTGPFYGFERVIETYEMTDTPYRLKPIDIYYHTYSASKPASLKALDKVYRWALAQETTPVYVSDYLRKVIDFNHLVVSRSADGWLISGADRLRELRAPAALGQPDLAASKGLSGFSQKGSIQYLHLVGNEAEIHFGKNNKTQSYLVTANARVENLQRSKTADGYALAMKLHGEMPLKFDLSLAVHCSVSADGQVIKADSVQKNISRFSMSNNVINELRISCPR
jgi:uncharacterized protein (TIGR01370 family)